jgi:hypothetical protein
MGAIARARAEAPAVTAEETAMTEQNAADRAARGCAGGGYGTALDFAEVEGLKRNNASRREWNAPGSEFLSWRADTQNWLGAEFCSFWWD